MNVNKFLLIMKVNKYHKINFYQIQILMNIKKKNHKFKK